MEVYKEFIFFNLYDFKEKIELMYNQLIDDLDNRLNTKDLFSNHCFTLLIGSENEQISADEEPNCLSCILVFPDSLSHQCSFWDREMEHFAWKELPMQALKDFKGVINSAKN